MKDITLVKKFLWLCVSYAGIWGATVTAASNNLLGQDSILQILLLALLMSFILFFPSFAFAETFLLQTGLNRFKYLSKITLIAAISMVTILTYDFLDGGVSGYAFIPYWIFGILAGVTLSITTIIAGCTTKGQHPCARFFGWGTLAGIAYFLIIFLLEYFGLFKVGNVFDPAFVIPFSITCVTGVIAFFSALFGGYQQLEDSPQTNTASNEHCS